MATNTNQMSLEQEVQSLQAYATEYSEQYTMLAEQLKFIETAKGEAFTSIATLESLGATEGEVTALLPLGGGVSVPATLQDAHKMLVTIGAGVTVEKTVEEAVTYLRDRITEMDASAKRLSENMTKLQGQMQAVDARMQEIYASVQKRQ
ncbi:MAG TPA: prefoldin subunit alpha [Methanocorpusculum sp.]|nr:prefoldin subunit alpha [Methanocorpusculum sp.]HJJ57758.1 prefoldin subunit alpha [Methanocorpusculum sp.]HJJ95438.1 prefoldin subunit alpha [Methanocorpusculum sp.]